uniref:Dehydrogenase/reductase SDR family member 7 n=1 Tax=Spermophilus dauricus TaxID=99837 RepID=A0A8C9QF45_SPEDA
MIGSQRPQQHLADWLLCGDAHWAVSLPFQTTELLIGGLLWLRPCDPANRPQEQEDWGRWRGLWELTGLVVWVTGASSGIGEELAYRLSKLGVSLVLSARRVHELERVKRKCLGE